MLKRSELVAATVPSIHDYFVTFRQSLLKRGIIERQGDRLRFTQDYRFDSPSTAAGVRLGRTANGRVEWKNTEGKTLKEIQVGEIGKFTTGAK